MKNLSKKIEQIEQGDAWKESDTVVQLNFKRPLDKVIPIRIQEEHWNMLRMEARELGVGPTTLARMWLLEHLRSKSSVYKDMEKHIQGGTIAMFKENCLPMISERESDILTLLVKGYSNKQIEKELQISPDTINSYLSEILLKLRNTSTDKATKAAEKKT